MAAPFITQQAGGVSLAVKLQPRASRTEIAEPVGNEIKIKVTAPPVDAAANQALVDLLAEKIGCGRGAVKIIRGQTSRHKTVWIAGVTADAVAKALGC